MSINDLSIEVIIVESIEELSKKFSKTDEEIANAMGITLEEFIKFKNKTNITLDEKRSFLGALGFQLLPSTMMEGNNTLH